MGSETLSDTEAEALLHGVLDALQRAVQQGKVRVAAYSGDNAPLEWALRSGVFGSVQLSVNVFDQGEIAHSLTLARERGIGVIAKRPLANAVWRHSERPQAPELSTYWDRMHILSLDPEGLEPAEVALRFTAFTPGVTSCIVGTTRLDNLQRNLRALEKGPLPEAQVGRLRGAFQWRSQGWQGLV